MRRGLCKSSLHTLGATVPHPTHPLAALGVEKTVPIQMASHTVVVWVVAALWVTLAGGLAGWQAHFPWHEVVGRDGTVIVHPTGGREGWGGRGRLLEKQPNRWAGGSFSTWWAVRTVLLPITQWILQNYIFLTDLVESSVLTAAFSHSCFLWKHELLASMWSDRKVSRFIEQSFWYQTGF